MRRAAWIVVAACSFDHGAAPTANVDGRLSDTSIDASPRCIGAWCRRKAIALHGVVGGPHASFPVLVDLVDAELAAATRTDGFDVMFADAAGTSLPYERVRFDHTTGKLTAWVSVPSLTASTVIYLYYGNPAAADQQNPAATWSAGYQGVWHLEEVTGALADASGHGNTGSANATIMLGMAAQVGRGARIPAGGIVRMAQSASLDSTAAAATFELLIKWTDSADTSYQIVMSSSNRYTLPYDGFEWASQDGGAHYFYPWGDPAQNDCNLGSDPYSNGIWHHAAVTLEFATKTVAIYVDGAAMPFTYVGVPTLWTQLAQPADWLWGGNPSVSTYYFDGMMDELRVSNVVRSADWLATASTNQLDPSAFATIGMEETLH